MQSLGDKLYVLLTIQLARIEYRNHCHLYA